MASYNLGTARGEIRITYDTSGIAQADAEIEDLQRRIEELGRQNPRIRVNYDNSGATRARQDVDGLQRDVDRLGNTRATPRIDLLDADARRRLLDTRSQLRDLEREVATARVNANTDEARARLAQLDAQLHRLQATVTRPNIDIQGTREAEAQLLRLRQQLNNLDNDDVNIDVNVREHGATAILSRLRLSLIGLAVAFGSALIPVLATASSLLAGIGGLAVVGVAGIAALGAAGIAAAAGIGLVVAAWKSMQSAILADAGVQEQLTGIKEGWKSLTESIKPQLIDATASALEGVNQILPQLRPAMVGAGNAVKALASEFDNFAGSPAMHQFTDFLGRQAGPAIQTFGHAALSGLTGVMGLIRGFEPIIAPAEAALTRFANRFATWGNGLSTNPGFKKFLDFIRQNAPVAGQLLSNLGGTITGLLARLAPVASYGLQILNQLFAWTKSGVNSPGFAAGIKGFLAYAQEATPHVAAALKTLVAGVADLLRVLAPLGITLVDLIKKIADFLRTIINSKGFAALAKGVQDLATGIGNFLDKLSNNTAFHAFINALGEALGKIGEFLGKLIQSPAFIFLLHNAMMALTPVLRAVGAVFGFLSDHMTATRIILGIMIAAFAPFILLFVGIVQAVSHLGVVWSAVWTAIRAVFQAVWAAIKFIFDFTWTAIKTEIQVGLAIIQAIWNNGWNFIKLVFQTVWNAIKLFFSIWWSTVRTIVSTYINIIRNLITGTWNAIRSVTSAVWNGIRSVISAAWSTIRLVVSTAVNAVRSVVTGAWNAIRSVTSGIWNAIRSFVSGAMNGIRSAVSAGANAARSAISGAFNAARSAVSGAIGGIIGFVRGMPGQIAGALGNLGGLLVGAGRALIDGLLNGIKSAVQGVYNFVSGIAGKIASLKGPIDADRKLLVPHGNAMMDGLREGLQQGSATVLSFVSGIASSISDSVNQSQQAVGALQSSLVGGGDFGGQVSVLARSIAPSTTGPTGNLLPSSLPVPIQDTVQAVDKRVEINQTLQYVGPQPDEVVHEGNRMLDWMLGGG